MKKPTKTKANVLPKIGLIKLDNITDIINKNIQTVRREKGIGTNSGAVYHILQHYAIDQHNLKKQDEALQQAENKFDELLNLFNGYVSAKNKLEFWAKEIIKYSKKNNLDMG